MPKSDERRPRGRPSKGLTQGEVLVKGPLELMERMQDYAKAEGISVREAWRRAAESLLGPK